MSDAAKGLPMRFSPAESPHDVLGLIEDELAAGPDTRRAGRGAELRTVEIPRPSAAPPTDTEQGAASTNPAASAP